MLNEFYKYIANNTISYFQGRVALIRPGERYCLRLDTAEMVEGVDAALHDRASVDHICGIYKFGQVYQTFTIKLSADIELVVASKTHGMTDDFFATLRNTELTEKHFPILMITHSPIDTITSGTGDLSAKGMPFHAMSIIGKVKTDIMSADLSTADRTLLEVELGRKQIDRFSDKSSLYEYSDLLTVLGRGYVKKEDYTAFCLLYDDQLSLFSEEKIRNRIQENHRIFDQIDRVFKHGNIADALEKEYDKSFIDHLKGAKKHGLPWYDGFTFEMVKSARDKLKKKLDNPLKIEDTDVEVYSGMAIEYQFPINQLAFIRNDGDSKAKQRNKNLIIFNPERKAAVTVAIRCNLAVKPSWVTFSGADVTVNAKVVTITIAASGCAFAIVEIKDLNNNITYRFKICVLNLLPKYLESLQTCYTLDVRKTLKNSAIQVLGIRSELIINPGCNDEIVAQLKPAGEYACNYNQTLCLQFDAEELDTDSGKLNFVTKCGAVQIPLRIIDESDKPVEMTGAAAFKWKHKNQSGLEYRNGKIIAGTREFYAKSPFKESLEYENLLVKNGWLAATESLTGIEECKLQVPTKVRNAYMELISEFREMRQLPSLSFYANSLRDKAEAFVNVIEAALSEIPEGETLTATQNDILMLGCVIRTTDEQLISMSPLHPLNILYQLSLLDEKNVGNIRDNLVEKLSCLYLLPYIKDKNKKLYYAIEQRHSPEWHIYAQLSNKRYQGGRSFVQKLISDKITQYVDHFAFLFKDLGNDLLCINLINMGDCREVLQGLIRYYSKSLKSETPLENLIHFDINIYNRLGEYNDFSVLSDQRRLREYINAIGKDVDDVGEMALILSSKIRCFYRNPKEAEYQYAHLAFYEMESSEEDGVSRMDSIATGVALGGRISGTPSVLDAGWYKTGFGTKYALDNRLTKMAKYYNAMFRVAFTGSSFEPESAIFTEIASGAEGQLGKIYDSSNWVVFVDPKVDLSFFKQSGQTDQDLMIIHYSDQYTSASGYDDITVTRKSEQYEEIIQEQLKQKGVLAKKQNVHDIISLFNAINGGWMLRLISAKKVAGAVDSNFSREKMSILSAIKFCMAYYAHTSIVWVPISLEEMLRVSGGAGYSKSDGLLSAKNLGFEKGATSDDILLVGIEGPLDQIKIYLHPVEVKIGQNLAGVITKAKDQVCATYKGLWNALWPNENRDDLECKLSRNFLMQLVIVCCEKMRLYEVYPDEQWEWITNDYREALLNERYTFSHAMDSLLGNGTVISYKTDVLNMSGKFDGDVCILEFPEKMGSESLVKSAREIERELNESKGDLPERLQSLYVPSQEQNGERTASDPNPVLSPEVELSSATRPNKTDIAPEQIIEDAPILPVSEESYQDNESLRKSMQVLFGTDVTDGQDLLWRPNDTNQVFHTNTGIIGTMGTGKTQFTKSIITQLYRDQKHNLDGQPLGILIFDYKGDYNESKADFVDATNATILKPYHLPFNPLALTKPRVFKPLLSIHTANAFKDTLAKVYGLGAKQQNILFSCITRAYEAKGIKAGDPQTWDNVPPTFNMVYNIYANDDDIKKTDSLAAAMDKLYQFQVFEGDPANTMSLFDMLNGVVVIDLSGYDADIQSLIVAITLNLFYAQMQASGSSKLDHQYRQLTKVILVDEADNFMSEGFPALKKILKEGREFGVGTILSTQFLKHFCSAEDDFAKYILTWVVHNVADLRMSDVEFVFKSEAKSSKTQMLFNDIKALEKHHSIVKIGTSEPRYIKDKAFWELYDEIKE